MKLSICLATYKRADWIAQTLDTILPQLGPDVELVIVDGGSPDNTEQVVEAAIAGTSHVRYFREATNSGVDQDFDKAVGYARGQYVWLFADDDLIAPGGVVQVLAELDRSDPDVLIVNSEVRDCALQRVLEPSRLGFTGRRMYGPGDGDALLQDAGNALTFIGCAVIRRSWWMARDRERYYGTLFVHVGVIFQEPRWTRAVVLTEPLVSIRLGNAMWTGRSFEIWMFLWPTLIWGLSGYSDVAKAAVTAREPWRNIGKLLLARASGGLGRDEYRRFMAGRLTGPLRIATALLLTLPGTFANLAAVILLGLRGSGKGSGMYNIVTTSPHTGRISRRIARVFGQSLSR